MWILFSQLSSFTDAVKNVFLKSVPREVDSVVMTWIWLMFTLVVLLPFGLYQGIPAVDATFWWVILYRMIFDPIAIFLFTTSMRQAEISLVLPLLTIGPVCTMISSFFINGEIPKPLGFLGFFLIVSGMYFLNLTRENGFLSPFKHLIHSRASVYMLIAAVIWGVQVSVLKIALVKTPAGFFTLVGTIAIFLEFTVVVLVKYRHQLNYVFDRKVLVPLSIVGLLDGITVYFRMLALSTGLAGYVSALNRTTIIFSSILGFLFFKEHLGKRVIPILVMLIGVILVTLG